MARRRGPGSSCCGTHPLSRQGDKETRRQGDGVIPSLLVSLSPSLDSGRRRSTNIETANLLAMLVRAGVKTLAFTRTRRGAELVLRYTREALDNAGSLLA